MALQAGTKQVLMAASAASTPPWPLQTERLAVAPPDTATARLLGAWAVDARVATTLWPQDRGKAAAPGVVLAARLRDGGAPVGELRLRPADGWLSYFIAPPLWGRGFATELVSAVCDPAALHMGLARLRAAVLRDNVASRRVLEKTGFRFNGLGHAPWARGTLAHAVLRFERCTLGVAA